MQVYYDFTFDRGYVNVKNIVQFNQYDAYDGSTATNINFQTPALISERLPEAERYCMLSNWGKETFDIDKGNDILETHAIPFIRTTQGFWEVFSPEILLGDTTGIFSSPGKAMISEKTAHRLFGDENPIDKSIRSHYGSNPLTIRAVYRDFPENSSLENGLYTYLREYNKEEWSFQSYFLIRPENLAAANEKINTPEILGEEKLTYIAENPETDFHYRLTSMNELYLTSPGKGGSKQIDTTVSLLMIGVLTLLIAFVNFVNLSLAMAPSRIRGINVRKILGINKTELRFSIAMESVLFTLIAMLIAVAGIYLLKGSVFAQEMFPTIGLSLKSQTGLLATVSGIILLTAFAIGLYTMRYSTSFDESEALKGSFALGIKGVKLRNMLIILQFTSAIVLICFSIFIQRQNNYMMHYDWGMPKKNIVYLPLAGLGEKSQSFGQELLRDPRITDYCITRALPGSIGMSWGRNFEGKQISLFVWSVDDRFFDFFEIDILSGRKPEHMDSIVSQIVVNEAFLKKYEFDESIVGKDFEAFGPGRLQAVAKDVNFQSLHEEITPMAFGVLSQWQQFQYLLVKLSGNELPSAIVQIEKTWKQFSKEPFEVHFLDEEMDRLYQKENNMAKLIGLFGFVIVIIAVMGVYGLILFNTKYKAKEIAIRKVNGSSEKEIMFLLNRSILIQLGIAFVIAVPVTYYAAYKWLENYAYKTSIHWWVFLLGGLIVLAITLLTVSAQSYKAATKNPTKALNSD
ncbi:ABC transporter permease [Bacteroidia bacterium]|nr:ABC transporter permease [Bacteroidia bacterium]